MAGRVFFLTPCPAPQGNDVPRRYAADGGVTTTKMANTITR